MLLSVWWIVPVFGLASAAFWYIREHGLAFSFAFIAFGSSLNWLALAANGGQMPTLTNLDTARFPWLCDIIRIPTTFHFFFGRNEVTAVLGDVGGYYSVGDFIIGGGVAALVMLVFWRVAKATCRKQ